MKTLIKRTVVMAAILTSAQADFSLGTLYDEMKEVLTTFGDDRADTNKENSETVTVATAQATTKAVVETH